MSSSAPIEQVPIHLYIPGDTVHGHDEHGFAEHSDDELGHDEHGPSWIHGDVGIDALWIDAGKVDSSIPLVLRLRTTSDLEVAAGSPSAGIAVHTADTQILLEHDAPDSLKRRPLYLMSRPPSTENVTGCLDEIAHGVDDLRKAGFETLFCCMAVTECVALHRCYSFLKHELGVGTVVGLRPGGEGSEFLVHASLQIGSLFYDALADMVLIMPKDSEALNRRDMLHLLHIVKSALSPLGRYPAAYTLISCPMCGRCEIDITGMTRDVDRLMSSIESEYRDRGISLAALGGISVAVMGCNVNGPGEARSADIGIAGGRAGTGTIFMKGNVYETLPEAALMERFSELLHTLIDERADA